LSKVFCASIIHGRSTSLKEYKVLPTWKTPRRESKVKFEQIGCCRRRRPLAFEFKPYIIPNFSGGNHLTQLFAILPRRHADDELFFESEVLII
jgi:hypothetical protein